MMYVIWLLIFGVVGYFIGKSGRQTNSEVNQKLANQNRDWAVYLQSFRKKAVEKSQKKLLDEILKDINDQGIVGVVTDAYAESNQEVSAMEAVDSGQENYQEQQVATTEAEPYLSVATKMPQKPKTEIQLDNASLLLYLGAFIFVASIGLFVAFGGFDGTLKTLIVLLLAITVYVSGIVLFSQTKKYKQVGVAFAAIGMAIVPFVGLAAYLYIFDKSNGAEIWFATSILCLVVYTHALIFFKNLLLNYIFIFTILSLFESGVSITSVPLYYYGWMAAVLGIALGYAATFKNIWPSFRESSSNSGQVLMPVALAASAYILPSQGNVQMGVTLLLATAFYGLQAVNNKDTARDNYAAVTQVLGIAGLAWLTYGISHSFNTTAVVLIAINILQLLAVLVLPRFSNMSHNFASIIVGSTILGAAISFKSPWLLLISVLVGAIAGGAIWLRQQRIEGYIFAVIGVMSIPVVIGQLLIENGISMLMQSVLLLASLAVQWIIYVAYGRRKNVEAWKEMAQFVFVASVGVVALSALFASSYACLAICFALALLMLGLAYIDKDSKWAIATGAVIVVPVARSFSGGHELLFCVLAALLANILLALKFRQEFNRWLGSFLWFIMPIALGNSGFIADWTTAMYAYSYMIVAVGFVAARAVARGVWFISSKVPMASYAKNASVSYTVGYGLAITTSIVLSVFSTNSQVLTTALLGITMLLVLLIAKYIEKERELYAILPVLAQGFLISAVRPNGENEQLVTVFVLSSSVLATGIYALVDQALKSEKDVNLKIVSLIMLFVAPISVLLLGSVWAMPVSLMVATAILYYHYRSASQVEHEAIGGIFTVGILWLMWQLGVREIQAFSHVIVALFAGYAYWRSKRGESSASNQYILAMLTTATVPLVLQGLSGSAGGLYGWWLLIEQIVFIMIGVFISSKLMIRWGLYVAAAAVLYQLRGLGWAALAFLGIFVIAVAAYQIQRINKN